MPFWLRLGLRHIENYLRYAIPLYDWCPRCGRKFQKIDLHLTPFYNSKGGFTDSCLALCKKCWDKLTPEQRLPHYEFAKNSREWEDIKQAVLNGK